MKIYTKSGDDGSTGLYGGRRVPKTSLRIHAVGEIDELNSALGVVRSALIGPPHAINLLFPEFAQLQSRLFDLGAELANPDTSAKASIRAEDIRALEVSIDSMSDQLPPLKAFILPGGSAAAAAFHSARAICRRSERAILELHNLEPVSADARIFVNRLSDWLFTGARWCNLQEGISETEWRPRPASSDEPRITT